MHHTGRARSAAHSIRRLLARVARAARCGGAIIIIGNGSVWRRRGAYLRRCLLLRRRRYLLLVARRLIAPGLIAWRLIALWLGAELLRDCGGGLRRRGARRLKLRCRAERLRGQNRLRQMRGTRLRLFLRRRGLIVQARIRRGQSGQDAVDRINGQAANEAAERKPFGPKFSFRLAIFGVCFCTKGGARILCIFIGR